MFELALPLFSDFYSVLFDSQPQPNFLCLCIREQAPLLNTPKKKNYIYIYKYRFPRFKQVWHVVIIPLTDRRDPCLKLFLI